MAIVCETSNAIHGDDTKSVANDKPVLPADQWKKFGADLEAIAQYCADQGVDLVYHHHMGTIVQTGEEIDLLMQNTGPATKLLLDTGHAWFGGSDPAEVAKKCMHRVRHIHVQERAHCRAQGRRRAKASPSSRACAAASSPFRATAKAASISSPS